MPGYFVSPNTLLFSRIGYRRGKDGEDGLALGAGVGQFIADNVELRLEYVYTRYGALKGNMGGTSPKLKQQDQNVRLGASYHF